MISNSLNKNDILRSIDILAREIKQIKDILQGQPIGTVRIADLAVTSAKIGSISADKITTGTLGVSVAIKVRNQAGTADGVLIGYQENGFD